MRKAIRSLTELVASEMRGDIFSQSLFVFCNRRRNVIKILYWNRNGFCLWQKRLEEEKFFWPRDLTEVQKIKTEELKWLLSGLDFRQAHKSLDYSKII